MPRGLDDSECISTQPPLTFKLSNSFSMAEPRAESSCRKLASAKMLIILLNANSEDPYS